MVDKDTLTRDLDETTLFAFLQALKPRELGAQQRESLRSRILSRIGAPAPEGTSTVRAGEGGWSHITPLVEIKVLRRDLESRNQTVLYRLHPGAELPGHPHTQDEECLVLDGEIHIGDHVVRRGDMHIANAGSMHPPVSSPLGALLLVRSEIDEVHVP